MLYFFLCFLTAFLIAYASMPTIIRIAGRLSLFDQPDDRKRHPEKIPLLGGIAIFAASLFSFTIWSSVYFEAQDLFIIAALIIIFFFGLRDDIAPLAPLKKLSGQIIASAIVVLYCNIRLEGIHPFAAGNFPWIISAAVTIVAMLFIINAFNFIDGIDGLAGGLGIISAFIFGILFYLGGDYLMAILAISLVGALMGFIPYNFYRAKIFMGDTGTMTTGFLLSLFAIRFIQLTHESAAVLISPEYAPVFVLSVLIIPVADMLRVFIVRLVMLRSPFSADRNHIHHRLLALGLTPAQSSIILFSLNILYAVSAWIFRDAEPLQMFFVLLVSAFILTQLPHFLLSKRKKQSLV